MVTSQSVFGTDASHASEGSEVLLVSLPWASDNPLGPHLTPPPRASRPEKLLIKHIHRSAAKAHFSSLEPEDITGVLDTFPRGEIVMPVDKATQVRAPSPASYMESLYNPHHLRLSSPGSSSPRFLLFIETYLPTLPTLWTSYPTQLSFHQVQYAYH